MIATVRRCLLERVAAAPRTLPFLIFGCLLLTTAARSNVTGLIRRIASAPTFDAVYPVKQP